MTFPPQFLEELRERVTLSDFIGKRMRLTRAGREFKGCCPFHKEKTPSFYVNDEKRFYHCFGCGAHGDIVGFAMRNDGQSFLEAVETLANLAGLQVPQNTPEQREVYDREKRLLDLLERATLFFEEHLRLPSGREGLEYFRTRGLTGETIRQFRLGFAPQDAQLLIRSLQGQGFTLPEMMEVGLIKKAEDRPDHYSFFRNRIMFPVPDKRGRTVAFGARIMGSGEPKYLNSPDHPLFHKGRLLYGLARARAAVAQGQPLIIVEGYMDVIALSQAGYMGALAPLGTALTEDQLTLLWRLLPPLDARDRDRDYSPILCFDGDGAGLKAAVRAMDRALPLLTEAQTARVAYLPQGEDPDSLVRASGRGAFQSVIAQAKPMIDALWDVTLGGRKLETPEERATASRAIRQKVMMIRDEGLRQLYRNEVEKRLSTLFHWSPDPRTASAPPGGFKRKTPLVAPPSPLPRRKPTNALRLREKILIALMVNHPALFNEFGDEFSGISFFSKDLDDIRQKLVHLFSDDSHETLDVEALYRHLSVGDAAKDAQKAWAEVMSEATYMHAGFARPDRPIEQARQGWKSIWSKYLQEQLQADLQAANHLWRDDPSDANLARLMALRQQMEHLLAESAHQELTTGESLPDHG